MAQEIKLKELVNQRITIIEIIILFLHTCKESLG